MLNEIRLQIPVKLAQVVYELDLLIWLLNEKQEEENGERLGIVVIKFILLLLWMSVVSIVVLLHV